MKKETKTKLQLAIGAFSTGIFLLLESLHITQFDTSPTNTPGSILALVSLIFIIVGVMLLFTHNAKLNHLFASILTSIMGIVIGWAGLFGEESKFYGNNSIISFVTIIPMHRILFVLGSLLCFFVSAYAFKLFLQTKSSDQVKREQ